MCQIIRLQGDIDFSETTSKFLKHPVFFHLQFIFKLKLDTFTIQIV